MSGFEKDICRESDSAAISEQNQLTLPAFSLQVLELGVGQVGLEPRFDSGATKALVQKPELYSNIRVVSGVRSGGEEQLLEGERVELLSLACSVEQ